MSKRKVPSTSLPHSVVIPHTSKTRRLVRRLNKPGLTALALRWLQPTRFSLYAADLSDANDAEERISLEAAIETYDEFGRASAVRAKDVAERMLEHEWRNGVTLLGLAELEWQYLLDHPTSSKWQSFLLSPLTTTTANATPQRPRFHTSAFLSSLQTSLRPIQTAHFFATTHPSLPLTLIRVSLHNPHTPPTYPPRRKLFWLAFPSSGDHLFTTLSATTVDGLRDIVTAGIATAVSRANARFDLKPGRFVAKTLQSLCAHRGAEGASGGLTAGWGIYIEGFENGPLAVAREVTTRALECDEDGSRKRRKMVAARFGSTKIDDGKAIESAYFEVQEKFAGEDGGFRPTIGIRLEGTHVFAGIRDMAEKGRGVVVERLPGWMVGEEGVTSGVVRNGKLLRKKGDGKFSRA